MKRVKRILISQIFFLIAVSIIANKAFFNHIHILPDGKIIVHAHPYLKKGQKGSTSKTSHSHTNFLFCTIEHTNRFDCVSVDFKTINLNPELPLLCIIDVGQELIFNSFFTDFGDIRGSPILPM